MEKVDSCLKRIVLISVLWIGHAFASEVAAWSTELKCWFHTKRIFLFEMHWYIGESRDRNNNDWPFEMDLQSTIYSNDQTHLDCWPCFRLLPGIYQLIIFRSVPWVMSSW
jgi:hypothetical protein